MAETPVHMWAIFWGVVALALVLDIVVLHRKAHKISLKQALGESAAWIGLALAFNLWIYLARGPQAGVEFLTGYLVEKSLSLDNVFVFLIIFRAFGVPAQLQHKVLYYGVLGALVLRGVFVLAGVGLLQHFHYTVYVFGAILFLVGLKMLWPGERTIQPEKNWLVRLAKRVAPVQHEYEGGAFWVKRGGKWNATPLFLALVAVEAMDIVFAVDSVPAVLAITRDTFIVFSSNAFAILGLRALYFAVAEVLSRVRFIHQGLAAILIFVGAKMVSSEHVPISAALSLGIIAGILVVTIAASLAFPQIERTQNTPG